MEATQTQKPEEVSPSSRANPSFLYELPKTMRAIPFTAAHKAEQLQIKDFPTPQITNDNEVIVEVRAFGLNFADVSARRGQYGDAPPYPYVPGYECAGEVVGLGPAVKSLKLGQKVMAGLFNFGGYAQFAKTQEEAILPLPEGWTFSQGAGIIVTSLTAYHALFETGPIFPGDRVLIHACAGGVGLQAVQLALHAKCQIIGTCGSDEKVKLLTERGVHFPINYRKTNFENEVKRVTNGEGVDIIIDSIGGENFKKDMKILRTHGRLIGIGASNCVDRSLSRTISLISEVFSMSTMSSIDMMINSKGFYGVNMKKIADHKRELMRREFTELVKLYASGVVKPEIHHEFSWNEIGKAHHLLESRQTTGKVVMLVDPPKREGTVSSPVTEPSTSGSSKEEQN